MKQVQIQVRLSDKTIHTVRTKIPTDDEGEAYDKAMNFIEGRVTFHVISIEDCEPPLKHLEDITSMIHRIGFTLTKSEEFCKQFVSDALKDRMHDLKEFNDLIEQGVKDGISKEASLASLEAMLTVMLKEEWGI